MSTARNLCSLCKEFASDVIALHGDSEKPLRSARWGKNGFNDGPFGADAFLHHKEFEALVSSSPSCALCRLLTETFGSVAHYAKDDAQLGLFPWSSKAVRFSASFDPSRGAHSWWSSRLYATEPPPWTFVLCRVLPMAETAPAGGQETPKASKTGGFRAVAGEDNAHELFETARFWMADCNENHTQCKRAGNEKLPTRVIDLGESSSDTARLLSVDNEKGPYAALSHCWGGDVPCKLLDSNLKEYETVGLPADALPQNFKDAIEVTRELGIRYLWIDALCIIQDSKPDWKTEAVRMVDYYANARVTVTVLDANSSRDGFLSRNHQGPVQISLDLAIQRLPLSLSRTLEKCPLETRGWCLQEQLLSPVVLHFSKEQVFWECQTLVRSESEGMDANVVNNLSPGGRVNSSSFDRIAMRNSLATSATGSTTLDHMNWNSLVEEYTRRKLTFGTDKLPALSAIAHRFRYARDGEEDALPASEPGYYAAGLWTHNITRGILWRPQLQMALRANAGFTQTVSTLSTPPGEPLAPSWSWTSVDGPVEFYGQKAQSSTEKVIIDPAIFMIVSVDMSVGGDDLTAAKTQGRLTVRGPVVKMEYWPPGSRMDVLQSVQKFAGSLFLGEKRAFNTVVMDVERDQRRDCWVMITAREKLALLILDQVDAKQSLYRRVGSGVLEQKVSDEVYASFTESVSPHRKVVII